MLKVKVWRKLCHANTIKRKLDGAVLISDKADFRTKVVVRRKEGHHIMPKGSVIQKDIAMLDVYAPNNRTSNCMRQTDEAVRRNGQIHQYIWRFQHPLSIIDRASRQKTLRIELA